MAATFRPPAGSRHEIVRQVRGGLGLMCAVEIVADRATKEPFPRKAGRAAGGC
jgi:4-aminobutyrate aminotransferase-like enzyme